MAEHPAEVAEITSHAQSLALNLGNITDARMKSMPESLKIAASLHIPVMPVVDTNGSDSAMLDNTLEFLVMNGVDLPLAVMMCIPEPWEKNDTISQTKKDFYQYYATMMEPWDGPASILFSDGD